MFWVAGGGSHAVDFMYSFWLKFGLSGSFRNRCLHLMSYSKRLRELLMLFVGFLCLMQKFSPSPRRVNDPGGISVVDLQRLCIALLVGWFM